MKQLNLAILAVLISFCSYAVSVSPITGAGPVCQGHTITLSDATSGGTWSSSTSSIATVGSTGVVTGVSAGIAVITYTVGASYATATVTVNAAPTIYILFVGGSGGVCAGATAHIFLNGSQPGVSYQLYNGASPAGGAITGTGAALDFGGYSAGSYTAVATNPSTGCTSNMSATATIYTLPTPAPIVGPSSVCVGSTISLSDTSSGGSWSSSATPVATVSSTGVVSGITAGSTIISYTLSSGCSATQTINAVNLVPSISGAAMVCTGASTTLTDASSGGTWTSSNPSIATIGSSSGAINGIAAGTTVISYTITGTCGAAAKTVSVHTTPGSITGVTSVCAGAVATLSDPTAGGTWSSSNTSVATIGSTSGIAASVAAGTTTISYTVAGCSATTSFNVDPRPVITGPTHVCVTSSIILNTSINGSWTSSNPGVASVTTGFMEGIVTGLYPGTSVMTCNSYATGCVSTYTVTVTSACSGTPTAGAANAVFASVCSGNVDTLYLTGHTSSCGISFQWQYSTDSLAWGDMPGATADSAIIHPEANYFYRCRLTCFSSGLFAYSAGVRVRTFNHISSHSALNNPSTSCVGPDYHLTTCGVAPTSNILTLYGDASSDSTHIISTTADSSTSDDIFHNYSLPGMYTVKQVLRNGTSRIDSVTFFYSYNHCRTLPVFFYFDANSNCINDNGDGSLYLPVTTEVDSNGIPVDTVTAINGLYYKALGDTGTVYSFRVISHDTGLHLSCPAAGVLYDTINSFANTYTTKSFGFSCNTSTSFNLGIRAGVAASVTGASGFIEVDNRYCVAESTVVVMNVSPKYNYSNAWPAPYSIAGRTITWHLPPLTVYNPSGGSLPYIWYTLTPATTLSASDTVNSTFRITPYAGDVDTSDNFIARVDTIRSSFSADRISVSPRGLVIPCTPLVYTINFSNVGNDTAHNMYVIDTLPDNVDASTIKVLAASSVVNTAIVRSGSGTLVKFDLPGINLPDSSHHNRSNGVVVFSVQAKQALADGAALFNHASVYADDNQPVLTDTAETKIGISPITGPSYLCNGTHVQLNDASESGTWSTGFAHTTVSSGLVTGVSTGADTIKYTLSNSCGTRVTTKPVTVNAVVTPSVTISNNFGTSDTVCEGVIPVFSVTPVNGGTTPSYLWQVNNSLSDTGSAFSYIPTDGDTLSVTMTSSALCAIPDTANKTIVLSVIPPYAPPVTLDAYPSIYLPTGVADTFVATVPPGGPTPTYQWLLNGSPIAGATTDTFIQANPHNNDSITVVITGTDLCHLSTFNSLVITVGGVGVKNLTSKAEMILFPNPNNGTFTVRGKTGQLADEEIQAEVLNTLGAIVYRKPIMPTNGLINEQIKPDSQLPKGLYLLNLHVGSDNVVFRFIVE